MNKRHRSRRQMLAHPKRRERAVGWICCSPMQSNPSRSVLRLGHVLRLFLTWVLALTVAAFSPVRSANAQSTGAGNQQKSSAGGIAVEAERTGTPQQAAEPQGPDVESTNRSHLRRPAGIPTTPVEVVAQLRWWIVPFVVASIVAVWFSIERLVVLRRSRVIPRPFVERFLKHLEEGLLDAESALKLCEENGSPVAEVFAHGIRKWGKPSVEIEQAIIDGGERQVSQLRKHLRVLNGVATVTPLLGLLGTVVGMIQAFNDIAVMGAMGRPEQLAVGIAIALLTTAIGLAIAIPSLIMYLYLAGRVDSLVSEMDILAQNVVQLISSEALSGGPIPLQRATSGRPGESKKAV